MRPTTKMSLSVIQIIKRIALNGSIAIALSRSASTEGRAQSMDKVINETSSFLARDWANDSDYNEWRPPQAMAIPASTQDLWSMWRVAERR